MDLKAYPYNLNPYLPSFPLTPIAKCAAAILSSKQHQILEKGVASSSKTRMTPQQVLECC